MSRYCIQNTSLRSTRDKEQENHKHKQTVEVPETVILLITTRGRVLQEDFQSFKSLEENGL